MKLFVSLIILAIYAYGEIFSLTSVLDSHSYFQKSQRFCNFENKDVEYISLLENAR